MNKYFFISNRQSGKTNKALYEFSKNPENSVFITHSQRENIRYELFKKHKNKIFTQDSNFRGIRVDKIIVDEYMLFSEKQKIRLYHELQQIGASEIYIFTTLDKIYNKYIFKFVVECKKSTYQPNIENFENYIKMNNVDFTLKEDNLKVVENEINSLYNNFITDPDCKIIFEKDFLNRQLIEEKTKMIDLGITYSTEILPDNVFDELNVIFKQK